VNFTVNGVEFMQDATVNMFRLNPQQSAALVFMNMWLCPRCAAYTPDPMRHAGVCFGGKR
jgi:hypothetical protein